jgi:hypothetical protein
LVLASEQDGNAVGSWIVAGARCVPVLRSLVSSAAGVARMPLVTPRPSDGRHLLRTDTL